ncbi:MAG: hypothetical protein IT168_03170 [Bryobacterales bacterium]|nr:hypothetical protein [Bryobacterales bacterium]
MDTRQKIITAEEIQRVISGTVVIGFFDPLLAEHAERLAALPAPVVILLADPPDPLLSARSRAELLAGLAAVSQVVMPLADGSPCLAASTAEVVDERPADLIRRQGLIAHVHRRHQ